MRIDNLVQWEMPDLKYLAPWRVVRLSRRVDGLFRNDTVGYLQASWRVYEIREAGEVLVLRPQ